MNNLVCGFERMNEIRYIGMGLNLNKSVPKRIEKLKNRKCCCTGIFTEKKIFVHFIEFSKSISFFTSLYGIEIKLTRIINALNIHIG